MEGVEKMCLCGTRRFIDETLGTSGTKRRVRKPLGGMCEVTVRGHSQPLHRLAGRGMKARDDQTNLNYVLLEAIDPLSTAI